jgi:hypothetical protein
MMDNTNTTRNVHSTGNHSDIPNEIRQWFKKWINVSRGSSFIELYTPARLASLMTNLKKSQNAVDSKQIEKNYSGKTGGRRSHKKKKVVVRRCCNSRRGSQLIVCRNSLVQFATDCRMMFSVNVLFQPEDVIEKKNVTNITKTLLELKKNTNHLVPIERQQIQIKNVKGGGGEKNTSMNNNEMGVNRDLNNFSFLLLPKFNTVVQNEEKLVKEEEGRMKDEEVMVEKKVIKENITMKENDETELVVEEENNESDDDWVDISNEIQIEKNDYNI